MTNREMVKLKREDLDTLIQWAAEAGWNPGPNDADVFWETDPDGFYGFFENNELLAGGAVVAYGSEYGFMGLFIVKAGHRRRGLGRTLWRLRKDLMLMRLKPGAPVGMDGVVAMQPFYRKGGFEMAFRDVRMEAMGSEFDIHPKVLPISEEWLPGIHAYDTQCFGTARKSFLHGWLRMPRSHAFLYHHGERILGFVHCRQAARGFKIGPLFADDAMIASELLKACLSRVPGEPLYLDIPMINEAAVALAGTFGMKPVFECGRMYHGHPPAIPWHKVFGITSFELG